MLGDPAFAAGPGRGRRAGDAFRVPFSVVEGFLLVVWSIVSQLVVVIPAQLFGVIGDSEGPATLVVIITSQAVALAGALAWLAARDRLSWRLAGPRRPSVSAGAIGLGVGVTGFIGVNLLIAGIISITGPTEGPDQQLLEDATLGGASTVLTLVVAVVMAPVIEETIFRGVLFQALRSRIGLWPGALISGLAFAAVHLEVTQLAYSAGLAALGMFFAWVFHRFGSLLVPILAHAAFNAVSLGLTIVSSGVSETTAG